MWRYVAVRDDSKNTPTFRHLSTLIGQWRNVTICGEKWPIFFTVSLTSLTIFVISQLFNMKLFSKCIAFDRESNSQSSKIYLNNFLNFNFI